MGRGDSALRYIGKKPKKLATMVDSMRVVKGLVAGKEVDYDGNPRFRNDRKTRDQGVGDGPIIDIGAYEFIRMPSRDETGGERDPVRVIPAVGQGRDTDSRGRGRIERPIRVLGGG